jgi:hypothetical protein
VKPPETEVLAPNVGVKAGPREVVWLAVFVAFPPALIAVTVVL